MNRYGIQKEIRGDFATVITRVKDALQQEGFGVLTEINVQDAFKKKLDVDYPRYYILGACLPSSAYAVLQKEPSIGLLLPCNVIVYQKNSTVSVEAIRPTVAMEMVENKDIAKTAQEVENKLERAIESL